MLICLRGFLFVHLLNNYRRLLSTDCHGYYLVLSDLPRVPLASPVARAYWVVPGEADPLILALLADAEDLRHIDPEDEAEDEGHEEHVVCVTHSVAVVEFPNVTQVEALPSLLEGHHVHEGPLHGYRGQEGCEDLVVLCKVLVFHGIVTEVREEVE